MRHLLSQPKLGVGVTLCFGIRNSEQSHANVMRIFFGKGIAFGPAFLSEVRDDVLPGDGTGGFPKDPDGFPYAGFVMSNPTVTHTVALGTLEFVEPAMEFCVRFAKKRQGFTAMLGKS